MAHPGPGETPILPGFNRRKGSLDVHEVRDPTSDLEEGAWRIREPALMAKPAYVYRQRSPLASCSWLGRSAAAARQDYAC
jgi:hypothetical protein